MLNCSYCDYLKNSGRSADACYCKLSGYVFGPDDMVSSMEYPCKDFSYEDYLKRENYIKVPSILKGDDWKVLYKTQNPAEENERELVAV